MVTLLLAVFALIGIIVSLIIQTREAKANREQALRMLHFALMKMSIEDEVYRECWGPIGSSVQAATQRQHMYTNLIVSHWQLMFDLGAMNEVFLRAVAEQLFAGEVGVRPFEGFAGDMPADC